MLASEMIRHFVFWGVDHIKGSPVASHYNDLKSVFFNPQKCEEPAKERLSMIIDHAKSTTDFYKQFSGSEKLSDFPVIQKKTIKENYEAFLSDVYTKRQLVKMTTSGSYGVPFTFYLSKDKRARQQAEVIFFNSLGGYKVGMRYAQVRVHSRSNLLLWMQNGYLINPESIDESWLQEQRSLLKKKKFPFIASYPSAILAVSQYCKSRGDRPEEFGIKSIISNSEPLLEFVRERIGQVFDCPVFDRYCTNELGVVAHDCPECFKKHVNTGSYKLELLKVHSDEPITALGETGRIVVTDYFSFAMPLIRYDTGDLGAWDRCDCGLCGPVLGRIDGRSIEAILSPEGKAIAALTIDKIPKDIDDIMQFQFIQKTSNLYIIKLQVKSTFDQEQLLLERLSKVLGPEAQIKIVYVDQIPPLPSGKRPYIINEFSKKQIQQQ